MATVGLMVLLFVAVASGFVLPPKGKENPKQQLKDVVHTELDDPLKSAQSKLDVPVGKDDFKKVDLSDKSSSEEDLNSKKPQVSFKVEDAEVKTVNVKKVKDLVKKKLVRSEEVLSVSDQSEDGESDETLENGKAPAIQILPFFGDEKEERREPQVLNGFGQHQEALNDGGIEIAKGGYLGFGHYNNPSVHIHPQEVPTQAETTTSTEFVKREPQVLNGFGQHQKASNDVGIEISKGGYLGFGHYNNPSVHIHPQEVPTQPETTPTITEFVKREPQVLNGFGQHQEAENGGGIVLDGGHLGFGDYNNPEVHVH